MHSVTYEEIVKRIPLLTADEQLSLIDVIRQQQSRNPSRSVASENGARPAVKRVPVRSFEAERA